MVFKKKKKKENYSPFLSMGFNCFKAREQLRAESLFFTTKFPSVPSTHSIDLQGMKG